MRARRARSAGASRRTMSAASFSDAHAVVPSRRTNDAWPSASSARARSSGVPASSSACRAKWAACSKPARPCAPSAASATAAKARRPQLVGRSRETRRKAVMGDELDHLVAAPAEGRLDPVGDVAVDPNALPARQRLVGDVADERVLEDQLALAADGGAEAAEDQVAILQAVEGVV